MRIIFLIYLLLIIPVTANAAVFKIQSEPEGAEIYLKINKDSAPVKLGTTPFNSTVEEFKSKYGVTGTFFLEVNKEGHEIASMFLAPVSASDIDLNFKLKVDRKLELTRKMDRIILQLFEAQRLTRDKSFDSALKILDEVEKEESQISSVQELRGSIFYLKKDFTQALAFYRKAFALNPENKDAYSMKLYLEKALGIEKQ